MLKKAIPVVGAACDPKDSALLLPVHDELLLEVAPEALERLALVCGKMVDGLMPIHFPVDVKIGTNRFNAVDAEKFFRGEGCHHVTE